MVHCLVNSSPWLDSSISGWETTQPDWRSQKWVRDDHESTNRMESCQLPRRRGKFLRHLSALGDAWGEPLRDARRLQGIARLEEDEVDVLKRATLRFRHEEIHDDEGEGVGADVDEVVLPADGREGDGGDLGDEEVKEPVGAAGHGGDLRADARGRDLGRVHEGDEEKADRVAGEGHEVEDERAAGDDRVVRVRGEAGEADHGDAHQGRAGHEEIAAAEAVDQEDGERGHEELPRLQTAANDAAQRRGISEIVLEDFVRVEGDDIDAAHLPQDVDGDGEQRAV
nr:hypothetical protein CFP56_02756 [Quercus suber]